MTKATGWGAAGYLVGSGAIVLFRLVDQALGYPGAPFRDTLATLIVGGLLAALLPYQVRSASAKSAAVLSEDAKMKIQALEEYYDTDEGAQVLAWKRRRWGLQWFVWPFVGIVALVVLRHLVSRGMSALDSAPALVLGGTAVAGAGAALASIAWRSSRLGNIIDATPPGWIAIGGSAVVGCVAGVADFEMGIYY